MKFFDIGQEAKGVIAIGQLATGVFAFGQLATGVVAIGQLARGVFCIGQGAIGFVGVGMGAVGIFGAGGMIGVGGRGKGIVLPCVPSLGKPRVPPPTTTPEMLPTEGGWVDVALLQVEQGLALTRGGQILPVKLDRRVIAPALGIKGDFTRGVPVIAHIVRKRGALVCDRITYVPERPYKLPGFWGKAIGQFALLVVLGIAYWPAAGNDLVQHLGAIARWDDGPSTSTTSPPKAAKPTKPKR